MAFSSRKKYWSVQVYFLCLKSCFLQVLGLIAIDISSCLLTHCALEAYTAEQPAKLMTAIHSSTGKQPPNGIISYFPHITSDSNILKLVLKI